MYSKFKEAKRIGDIGFLKDKKRAAQEIAARRLMVSKTRERKEAGDRRRQLSTLHEQRSKDTSQSRSGAKVVHWSHSPLYYIVPNTGVPEAAPTH